MRLSKEQVHGKDVVKHLVENKKQLIQTKKQGLILSQPTIVKGKGFFNSKEGRYNTKEEGGEVLDTNPSSIRVKVVANMANFADSYMDVLAPDSWKKSIFEHGPEGLNTIHHLHDHQHTLDAKIGVVKAIYGEQINLEMLGVQSDVKTSQALVMETEVMKSYNERIFNQYKNGEINQHSIGLQYKQIELAVNDEEFPEEKEIWDKYFGSVINKEYVKEAGYFWYVKQIRLLENSAVLFGANELTPTLSTDKMPSTEDTLTEPADEATQKQGLDMNFINQNFKL